MAEDSSSDEASCPSASNSSEHSASDAEQHTHTHAHAHTQSREDQNAVLFSRLALGSSDSDASEDDSECDDADPAQPRSLAALFPWSRGKRRDADTHTHARAHTHAHDDEELGSAHDDDRARADADAGGRKSTKSASKKSPLLTPGEKRALRKAKIAEKRAVRATHRQTHGHVRPATHAGGGVFSLVELQAQVEACVDAAEGREPAAGDCVMTPPLSKPARKVVHRLCALMCVDAGDKGSGEKRCVMISPLRDKAGCVRRPDEQQYKAASAVAAQWDAALDARGSYDIVKAAREREEAAASARKARRKEMRSDAAAVRKLGRPPRRALTRVAFVKCSEPSAVEEESTACDEALPVAEVIVSVVAPDIEHMYHHAGHTALGYTGAAYDTSSTSDVSEDESVAAGLTDDEDDAADAADVPHVHVTTEAAGDGQATPAAATLWAETDGERIAEPEAPAPALAGVTETAEAAAVTLAEPDPSVKEAVLARFRQKGLQSRSLAVRAACGLGDAEAAAVSIEAHPKLRGGWEAHTTGIGSRLLARMGYVGGGLGSAQARVHARMAARDIGDAAGVAADGASPEEGTARMITSAVVADMPQPIEAEKRPKRRGIGAE